MSEIAKANQSLSTKTVNPWAVVGEASKPTEFSGVNPYYHHIQCKCGTNNYFKIFKPIQPTEENKENKLDILNPEVVASHRIIGLEGDVLEFKFGLAQNIMKAIDIEEGENKYVRCQTSKFEMYDSEGNTVIQKNENKPLIDPVFSPKKSKKEPREPNGELVKNYSGGMTGKLFGQVDPKYAQRMGIPAVRSCADCVRNGTNIFVDKPESEDKPPISYECKFTGELVMLVRRVAYKTQDPNDLMKIIVKWIDISELGSEYLNKPCVFVIPLTRGDMFNQVGGDYGYHYNLNKSGYPKTLQPIGRLLDQFKRNNPSRIIYGHTFEDIGETAPAIYQMPIQLMLTALTVAIPSKPNVILGQLVPDPEVQNDAARRAEHAWYVYAYEKGIANGTLDKTSDYPVYNPIYSLSDKVVEQKDSIAEGVKTPEVVETVQAPDVDDTKFWSQVRMTNRQES